MKLLSFVLIAFLLFSCGNNEPTVDENGKEINFHVEGVIEGASNETIVISASSQRGNIKVAETKTDANGAYMLLGNIPDLGIFSIQFGQNQNNALVIPLDKGDRVNLSGKLENIAIEPKISGTIWAKPLVSYMKAFKQFTDKQMQVLPKIKDPEAQLKKYLDLKLTLEKFAQKQIQKDGANPVNLVLTSLLFPSPEMTIGQWNPENLVALKKMEAAYIISHAKSPLTGLLSQQIAQIETEYENFKAYNSGTLAAPEIVLTDPSGNERKLSALKGKVVLIDFWASWCGPCRQENPNVVRLYTAHNKEGFEVFSVSLDQDKDAWTKAIAKDGLIWKNHVSDLKGWDTPLTQTYGFNSIPYTVLVNRQGNIVGVGLRGKELEQKLIQTLSSK